MTKKDFIVLHVADWLKIKEIPPTGQTRRLGLALSSTILDFLKDTGFLINTSKVYDAKLEDVVIHLSDLTPEGQDFIMSGADDKWLAACDRKSSKIRAAGASEEEGLDVYRDPSGLYERLKKFRKEWKTKLN